MKQTHQQALALQVHTCIHICAWIDGQIYIALHISRVSEREPWMDQCVCVGVILCVYVCECVCVCVCVDAKCGPRCMFLERRGAELRSSLQSMSDTNP